MDVEEPPVVCCGGLENDPFELGNSNPNIKFGVFSAQISLEPLDNVSICLELAISEVVPLLLEKQKGM
jgi:hypothetical protein